MKPVPLDTSNINPILCLVLYQHTGAHLEGPLLTKRKRWISHQNWNMMKKDGGSTITGVDLPRNSLTSAWLRPKNGQKMLGCCEEFEWTDFFWSTLGCWDLLETALDPRWPKVTKHCVHPTAGNPSEFFSKKKSPEQNHRCPTYSHWLVDEKIKGCLV